MGVARFLNSWLCGIYQTPQLQAFYLERCPWFSAAKIMACLTSLLFFFCHGFEHEQCYPFIIWAILVRCDNKNASCFSLQLFFFLFSCFVCLCLSAWLIWSVVICWTGLQCWLAKSRSYSSCCHWVTWPRFGIPIAQPLYPCSWIELLYMLNAMSKAASIR
jgi:hypothetical protein